MRTGRGIIISSFSLIVVVGSITAGVMASPLDQWVLDKIESDENLLQESILRENGRDIRLLESSTRYVPFFLESPNFGVKPPENNRNLASDLFERQKPSFLAGGYIYRIDFDDSSGLYALSAGYWNGSMWFSPELEKELEIEPLRVWAGRGRGDFSYASILYGVPPRLVVFDQNGELQEEQDFDLSDSGLSLKIEKAEQLYSQSGDPIIEMVSLSEYLRDAEPSWRKVEITSLFNFRNQQERPKEIQRISEVDKLTRAEAKGELRFRINGDGRSLDRNREVEVKTENNPADEGDTSSNHRSPETKIPRQVDALNRILWIIAGVLLLGMLLLFLKAWKNSKSLSP